jgi:predicted transcriptional regulator
MPRTRASTGEYQSTVSDDEIVAFVENTSDPPFRTTSDVSERFDIDRSAIYRRLAQLVADERLHKSKVGARAVVWYSVPDGESA